MNFVDKLLHESPAAAAGLIELANLSGPDYLLQCARFLQAELGVFAVSIGELCGPKVDQIRVMGYACRNGASNLEAYGLRGTPCLEVLQERRELCVTPDAMGLYPDDAIFQSNRIRSYVGVPLRDGFDRVFGLVCVFDDQPMSDPQQVLGALQWFATRIGSEAGAIRTRRNLLEAMRWMATTSPEAAFSQTTAHLCEVLQVTTAFAAEWLDSEPGQMRFVALRHAGDSREEFTSNTLTLSSTPFRDLIESDTVFLREGLGEQFPECDFVQKLGLESCLGVVAKDLSGKRIGHIGVAHVRPVDPGIQFSPVFGLYSSRVAAELQRQNQERERREMERVLVVKQKLESLGLMAGQIAHDFNNLLMAILGNANLAAAMLDADSPIRPYIDNIEAASISAGDAVSQLLDYTGHRHAQMEVLEVGRAVADAAGLVELTRHPSAAINYDLGRNLPPVRVDPAQFQQTIINLVLNAAEALGEQPGTIEVRVVETQLAARQIERLMQGRDLRPGRYLEIAVRDDGIGMEDATLDRMLEPFFSNKPDARGLGMSAVRGFVQACAGGLEITSKPGVGTTVCLYLPPAAASAVAKAAEPIKAAAGESYAVLIVDDELPVAEAAAALLKSVGYRVQVCGSCDEALAAAGEERFDCALIDVRMPGVDGWATLRRLRKALPGLPAVMMTGYARQTQALDLVAKFGVELLHKPFAQKTLVTAVRDALGRARLAESS